MIIMEFEEMRKIWDSQNNEPMYVINQDTMRKRVMGKKTGTARRINIIEIFIIILNVGVGSFLTIKAYLGDRDIFEYLIAGFMLVSAIYLIFRRINRLKNQNKYDRTMIGDLDHAISNADGIITIAKKIIWWYNLPIFLLIAAKSIWSEVSLTKWLIIAPLLILAYFLGNWGLNKCHFPRKQKLEALRNKLIQEAEKTGL